jgi:tRNA(Ile)-lysidine synthase
MDVDWPKPGHYVIAVSGGVDSMVLLHMLQARPDLKLTVAHFDHGIREDSAEDKQLVRAAAKKYGLTFAFHEGRLGPGTGEATARKARYDFLRQVRRAGGARAVITAHHQDDWLETAILNMLRGTGRRGLTSLSSRHDVIRPLLLVPKKALIDYAKDQGLVWREDITNQDTSYLRNYIRHRLLPRFSEADTVNLLTIVSRLTVTNRQLDELLVNQLHLQSRTGKLDRPWFNHLPHKVALEVMAAWLRSKEAGFDKKSLERLVVAAKTARGGKLFPVTSDLKMQVHPGYLALTHGER